MLLIKRKELRALLRGPNNGFLSVVIFQRVAEAAGHLAGDTHVHRFRDVYSTEFATGRRVRRPEPGPG